VLDVNSFADVVLEMDVRFSKFYISIVPDSQDSEDGETIRSCGILLISA
jgi:hypothetical protein